ncbi:MAG: deoxyribodipyrimidine photo-lyase [Planctomycetaceae bacterium]
MSELVIVWFRNDLRLEDHFALHQAGLEQVPVLPVFIWDSGDESASSPGAASRWWLHQSLQQFQAALKDLNSRLVIRTGDPARELGQLVRETNAKALYWNRAYDPRAQALEQEVRSELSDERLEIQTFPGNLLFEPGDIATKQGTPYRVFSPFWKACLAGRQPEPPLPSPKKLCSPKVWPESVSVKDLNLEPRIDWAEGLRETWTPGSQGAKSRWKTFFPDVWLHYHETRDYPSDAGTSCLSPHLHFGEVSPRSLWQDISEFRFQNPSLAHAKSLTRFLAELGWREFAHHVLFHFPKTVRQPLREQFRKFPWKNKKSVLGKWQRGQTGYPIVDAGMRELWRTGWMHNRVRMIVGSFLTKDLLISWKHGAEWFWETLVDADLANNTLGWQWISGCGADAAPYFRIFNPVKQGQKFDPQGEYVRRWIPELGKMTSRWIHEPWNAPENVLQEAGVILGENYPLPMVDHSLARKKALEAFEVIKGE